MKEYILRYLDLNSKNIFTRKKKFKTVVEAREFAKAEVRRMRKEEDINLVLESVEKVKLPKNIN